MVDKSHPFYPLGHNQEKIESEQKCATCGYKGDGFVRERYPDGGFAPLVICPECRCGY